MRSSGGGASRQLECQGVEQLSDLSKEKFRHPERVSGFQHSWTLKAMRFFRLHPQNDVNYHVENILESFKCKVLNDLTSYRPNVFKKSGFTLAEVLITLGVIGVVAALTMPTISKNYYKRTLEVKLEKTYAELQDAIRKSELENGNLKYWDFSTGNSGSDAFAKQYLLPYLSESFENCPRKCFNGNPHPNMLYPAVSWSGSVNYKTKARDKTLRVKVIVDTNACSEDFPGLCTTPRMAEIYIDIDGDRGPSYIGIDVHQFVLVSFKKLTGWGGGTTGMYYGLFPGSMGAGYYASYKLDDMTVWERCNGTSGYYPGDCTILLQRNNWKFPKDYPIKF